MKLKVATIGVRALSREGGIETYCRNVLSEVAVLGHEVLIYTRRRHDPRRAWRGLALVPTASLPGGLETLSHAFMALTHCAFVTRPDVVSFQAIGPALLAPFARLMGFGVVVRHVGEDWRRSKWGFVGAATLRLAERSAARFAHVVICLNDDAAKQFCGRLRPRAEVRVVRNPVPRPEPDVGREALERFGLTAGRYVLASSRITPEKGLETLVAAFGDSSLGKRGWTLLVAGDVRPSTAYRRRIVALAEATPDTILTGELDKLTLTQLYACAGLFVMPSHHEGMSFSLLEAMSHGLRCIVSDIPANRAVCDVHGT
ncbi:MAG TPA: glycosyltransferase family 4 protein, partial [Acidobacteriaceae bacterium]|nr:glycosyltransferase family 4 protein [Acidobacteriaceae bacterium]